tara:strand:- start:2985 stop:3515 length:531 start_codon:yes stop_codon:yes gene_type:complete
MKLIPFTPRHFELVCSWFSNEVEVVQWGGPTVCYPLQPEMLQPMLDEGASNPPGRLCWMAQSDGEFVGHVQLGLDWRNGIALVSRVVIAPEARGKGHGSNMVRLLLDQAFSFEVMQRAELNVYAWNRVAIRTYEKLGFRLEGNRRSCALVNGDRWDGYMMGLLREEWSGVRLNADE